MNPSLPSQIRVEQLRHGTRYLFPERAVGRARWLALAPILFGFFFAGVAVLVCIAMVAQGIFKPSQNTDFAWFFPLFFGLPSVLIGISIIRVGAFIRAGRCEIEVEGGRLQATERAWFFRKCQTVPTDKLRRFTVEALPFDILAAFGAFVSPFKPAALRAELSEGKPIELLRGYPLEWLEPLARELGKQCAVLNAAPLDVNIVAEPPPLFNLGQADKRHYSDQTDKRDFPNQPVGSLVRLEERADGLTLTVPPAGIMRGSKGLFVFGIIWNTFMTVFTTIFLTASKSKKEADELVFWVFIAVFWLIGCAMLLAAINMGRRRAVFMVAGDQLRLAHASLFGTKISSWSRDELTSIHVGPSGMAVNDVPVLELQIEPRGGKKGGLLGGRDEDELRWIATTLRRGLKLETQEPKP